MSEIGEITAFPVFRWSLATGEWERYHTPPPHSHSHNNSSSSQQQQNLKFVTYNVWFGSYHMEDRFNGLMSIVKVQNPDFVCFQEVTERFLGLLRTEQFIKENYLMFDPTGDSFRFAIHYGVLMMCKKPPLNDEFKVLKLPSEMGRRLLFSTFQIHNSIKLTVATVHLESLQSSAKRAEQLELIGNKLKECSNVILMGDFNLDSKTNENENVIKLGMIDAWPFLHPNEPGWTEDSSVNKMIPLVHSNNPNGTKDMPLRRVRFDRVLLRSESWKVSEIQLLGTQALSSEASGDPVWTSDHFGLSCTITQI